MCVFGPKSGSVVTSIALLGFEVPSPFRVATVKVWTSLDGRFCTSKVVEVAVATWTPSS